MRMNEERRAGRFGSLLLLLCLISLLFPAAGVDADAFPDEPGYDPGDVVSVEGAPGPESGRDSSWGLQDQAPGQDSTPAWKLAGPEAPDMRLGPLDLETVRQDDERLQQERGLQRIGVRRPLATPVTVDGIKATAGRWSALEDGGQVWVLSLASTGAQAIRVHLEDVALPNGVQIVVRDAADPDEAFGPFDRRSLLGQSGFWTPSVFAPVVTLICYVPPGIDGEQVRFRVREIAHVYAFPAELLRWEEPAGTGDGPSLGREASGVLVEPLDCHPDVSCYPAWADEADAVVGLGEVGNVGVVWCTGALLNDLDPETYAAYFMTANHCLSGLSTELATQEDADLLEFYWFYQTPECNGTPPDPATVPRTTGGADLISARTRLDGSEYAFLRLREDAPAGAYYAAWTTAAPGAGETLTGIHHPVYSHKRISWGTEVDSGDPNFLRVMFDAGTSQPGSSGSPLFDDEGQVVAQTRGGPTPAYCPPHDGAFADFGRFSMAYPNIRRWMEIGGTIHVNGGYGGAGEGTPTKPFTNVGDANAFAWDGVRIKIQAGDYPETLTFSKEMTLMADGGAVTIGEAGQ